MNARTFRRIDANNSASKFTADGDVTNTLKMYSTKIGAGAQATMCVIRSVDTTNAVDVALQYTIDRSTWVDVPSMSVTDVTGGYGRTGTQTLPLGTEYRVLCTTVGGTNNLHVYLILSG